MHAVKPNLTLVIDPSDWAKYNEPICVCENTRQKYQTAYTVEGSRISYANTEERKVLKKLAMRRSLNTKHRTQPFPTRKKEDRTLGDEAAAASAVSVSAASSTNNDLKISYGGSKEPETENIPTCSLPLIDDKNVDVTMGDASATEASTSAASVSAASSSTNMDLQMSHEDSKETKNTKIGTEPIPTCSLASSDDKKDQGTMGGASATEASTSAVSVSAASSSTNKDLQEVITPG